MGLCRMGGSAGSWKLRLEPDAEDWMKLRFPRSSVRHSLEGSFDESEGWNFTTVHTQVH
jgi:hypothetical protein